MKDVKRYRYNSQFKGEDSRRKWKNSTRCPTYSSWSAMINRCYRKSDKCYSLYGGRGIRVCLEWLNDYDAFYADMGERPDNHSIDRIDSNGDYEKENCRWATMKDQQNNRRNNVLLTIGNQTKTLAQWNDIAGMGRGLISQRISRGVPNDKLISSVPLNLPKHGTNNMYSKYNCRCIECTEFNRIKSQKARDARKINGVVKPIEAKYHGTRTGYELYKCKCNLCKEVNKIRSEKYRNTKKELT